MKKISMFCIAMILLWSTAAFALNVNFSMTNEGSDNVTSIQAMVADISAGKVGISIDVSQGPVVGDITGVFFDLNDINLLTIFSITDGYNYITNAGMVKKAPNNSNIGGNVPAFDVGVAVGNLGLTDDIQTLTIYVLGSGVEAAAFSRIGVRLQSVGDVNGRDGSAKYVGTPGGSSNVFPVPEPATIILMGMGLLGVAAATRRKIAAS